MFQNFFSPRVGQKTIYEDIPVSLSAETIAALDELARLHQKSREQMMIYLVERGIRQGFDDISHSQLWDTLSQREQEVAAHIWAGYTNPQIAYALGISTNTIKKHVRQVLSKFDVASKVELCDLLRGWDLSSWIDE